jgi:hypothetical protein
VTFTTASHNKPNAKSFGIVLIPVLYAVIFFKYPPMLTGRNANPVILNADFQLLPGSLRGNPDQRSLTRIFYAVPDQVDKHVQKVHAIDLDNRIVCLKIANHFAIFLPQLKRKRFDCFVNQRMNIDWCFCIIEAALFLPQPSATTVQPEAAASGSLLLWPLQIERSTGPRIFRFSGGSCFPASEIDEIGVINSWVRFPTISLMRSAK